MKQIFKKWRNNKTISLITDVVFIVLFMSALSWWLNRGSLAAAGQPAPQFELVTLKGDLVSLDGLQGKAVLLYFFAPWCSICRLSADNLNDLRAARDEEELAIFMMALSYESRAEVESFVADLDLQVPVLLGTEQQMQDYKIQGFPTYYVIDQGGKLASKSMGYSTELGMRVRTW